MKDVHKAANLLDPRYIGKHLSEEDAVDACELIANLAKCAVGISEDDVLAYLASYRSKSGLWSKPFIWSSRHKIEPLVWWNGMCSGRPLSVIATKILSLPTTSSACERSFSTYSHVHTAKRNRLTTARAGKLVYISQNLKFFQPSSHDQHHQHKNDPCQMEAMTTSEESEYDRGLRGADALEPPPQHLDVNASRLVCCFIIVWAYTYIIRIQSLMCVIHIR